MVEEYARSFRLTDRKFHSKEYVCPNVYNKWLNQLNFDSISLDQ